MFHTTAAPAAMAIAQRKASGHRSWGASSSPLTSITERYGRITTQSKSPLNFRCFYVEINNQQIY
jgi:hypothetical protein